jgi:hypothetical protein
MCTVLLPPGGNPIAFNKYIVYHIIKGKKLIHYLGEISWSEIYKKFRTMEIIFLTYILLFQVMDQVITWSVRHKADSTKSLADRAQK